MKKLNHILKLILINGLIFVVLLEVIALVIYFVNHKAFFYTHDKKGLESVDFQTGGTEDRLSKLTNKRFHPFFGYTHQTGSKQTNNYGFYCPHDFPLKREQANWYIIGIFGGSVANGFYQEGREQLTRQLQKNPAFAGKEIFYLNFALGGYKQPQQVQILSYFLAVGQQLDMVINIDGFNEVVYCFNNSRLNVDIGMPSAQHFLPMKDLMDRGTVTGEKLETIWTIRQLKKNINRIDKKLKHGFAASLHLIRSAYGNYLYKKYRRELVRFDQQIKPAKPGTGDSIVNIKYTPAVTNELMLSAKVATLWYRTSFIMNAVMTAGIDGTASAGRYFHILQPNQYYSNKTFTAEEKENALDASLPYNVLAKKVYPVLLKAVAALQKNHVKAYSAVGIFDKVTDTVYIDRCCHFNRRGNELLADFIAARILAAEAK
ncbi:MAG: hypothetical protein GY950_28385 [bacterium]|nr:hypothetical protein [bacterium]